MKRRNYTLVEILTVVAVIAILAGISVGVVGVINNKNAEAKTVATIKTLEMALAQYKQENHSFYFNGENTRPTNNIITISSSIPSNLNGTLWKYLDQKLINTSTRSLNTGNLYFVDGWERPLIYRVPGRFNRTGFDLGSAGPDGRIGDGGTELPQPSTDASTISDYNNFGQGDDITNFVRN